MPLRRQARQRNGDPSVTEDSKKRVNRTPKNKQPRKTGLRDLLSPSYEEARAGIRGITLEQEVVSVEELKARKRRRTAIMGVATIIFLVTVIVLSSLLIARLDPFKNVTSPVTETAPLSRSLLNRAKPRSRLPSLFSSRALSLTLISLWKCTSPKARVSSWYRAGTTCRKR